MTNSAFEQVDKLISHVRNAKFGEVVTYLEQLIETEVWRDFETPAGTHFKFQACEFDYFLASQEVDPTMVRWAYIKATDIEGLAARQFRLADITGQGRQPTKHDRREPDEAARMLDADPSGAGARIRHWAKAREQVVTKRTAYAAANASRRAALEAGASAGRTLRGEKMWRVRWSDERTPARAIAEKLLTDADLASEVYKILHADYVSTWREEKRRSGD